VGADAVLPLEHHDPRLRPAALQLARGGEADDAGADDRQVAVAAGVDHAMIVS
jgi:hypothetical protein